MSRFHRKNSTPPFAAKVCRTLLASCIVAASAPVVVQAQEQVVEEVVETVLEKAVVVAEKAEQVLDQTQERVNALRFTNEEEVIQVEEPKIEQTIVEQPKVTRPAPKNTNTPRKKSTSTTRKRRTNKTKTDT